MEPLVSVIIVTYNGKNLLQECFSHLGKSSYKNAEVIVVDNASTDDTLTFLKDRKLFGKKVIVVRNKKNEGFAAGNNRGVEKAKGDFLLLLNNDALVTPDTVEILAETLENNSSVAVVQPKIIFSETKKLQSGSAFLTPLGFLQYVGYGNDPKKAMFNHEEKIFSGNGACLLIKKDIIDKIGLFDEDFFAYYEETDFCHRVWLSKHEVLYQPKAIIYHKGAQTSGRIGQEIVFFHSFKNRVQSSIKNFQSKTLLFILPSLFLIYVFLMIFYLVTLRLSYTFAIFKSLLWNVTSFGKTVKKRHVIQSLVRKVPDDSYLLTVMKPFSFRYYLNMLLNKETL